MARETAADRKIVAEAQERFERAREWESYARKNFVDDMKFANGDSVNMSQWDDATRVARGDRPCLTVNKTRVHCLQIVNDARQNKASIRINAVGDGATYEAAQIFEGMCRHIEYISNASQAYDAASYNQVYGGWGYWRVVTDYAHDDTFDQEIYIRRIADPLEVYLDPDIKEYDGSDAAWGIVFKDLSHADYRAAYPDSDPGDLANLPALASSAFADGRRDWLDDKHIRVAEYYRRSERDDTLHWMSDGSTARESALGDDGLEALAKGGVVPVKSRSVPTVAVEWFLIAGHKIIDRKPWAGSYVPIVRLPCEEVVIEGKLDRISHVRHLRDAQRLYNYYSSSAAEFVALQTKSPFIGVAEAIEPYKDAWETANTKNHSVLLYKGVGDDGQPIPKPERSSPPVMAQAYMEGLKITQQEMMMVSGQYQAVMGAPSNETSGTAINARQRQGDNATYHVIDHMANAVRFTGRILLDLIPKIYDRQRVLLIMAESGDQATVHVDPDAPVAHATVPNPDVPPPQPDPQGQPDPEQATRDAVKTVFNPKIGKYSVVSDVGPSYATRRQEAFNAFSQIMANNHEAFAAVADFWAANADFPGADEFRARMKLGLPPQYKGGPSPEVQQVQQQAQQMAQQAHALLGRADAELAALKQQLAQAMGALQNKDGERAIRDYEAETKRLAAVGAIDPDALRLLVREMVSGMLGMPAVPLINEHAAHDAINDAGAAGMTAAATAAAQPNGQAAGPVQ